MAVREFDGELDDEPVSGGGFREFTGALDGDPPKAPGLADTLNKAGFFQASPRMNVAAPKTVADQEPQTKQRPNTAKEAGVAETLRQAVSGTSDAFMQGLGNLEQWTGDVLQAPLSSANELIHGARSAVTKQIAKNNPTAGYRKFVEDSTPGAADARARDSAESVADAARYAQEATANATAARKSNVASGNPVAVFGKDFQDVGKETSKHYQDQLAIDAPIMAQQMKNNEKATGFGGTLKSMLIDNPLGTLGTIGQSTPEMLLGMGAGKVAGVASSIVKSARAEALIADLAAGVKAGKIPAAEAAAQATALRTAAQEATEKFAGEIGMLAESASSVGNSKLSTEQFVNNQPHEKLAENSARYRELIAKGETPDNARASLAKELGNEAALLAGIGTFAGGKFFAADKALGSTLMGKKMTGKEFLRRTASETGQEGAQNPAENYAQYLSKVQADPTQKYDFGGSLAQGLASGLPMGAGMHGAVYLAQTLSAQAAAEPAPGQAPAPKSANQETIANAAELDATAGRDIDTLDQNLEARDATQARTGAMPDSDLPLINTPAPEITVQQLVGTEATPIQTLWAEAMIKKGKGIALDGYETYLMKYPPADVDVATAEQRVKQDVVPNNGIAAPVNMALPVTDQQQMLADEEAKLTPSRANSEALFSEDPTFDNIPGEANATSNQAAEAIPQQNEQQAQPTTTAVTERDLLAQATRQAFKDDAAVTQAIDRAEAENATQADHDAATQAITDAYARNPEIKQNAFDILQSLRAQQTPTQKVTAPRPAALANSPHVDIVTKALEVAQGDIQIHSPDSLGSEVSSVSSGQMGKYRAKTIERIAKAFGRKSVVFFSSASTTADGMTISTDPNTLYININSGIDPLAVVGHEWRHSIKRTNQAAHAAIQTAAKAILAKDGKLLEYANQYHGNEMQKAGVAERLARIEAGTATEQDMDFLAEEFSSDIAGNMWRDPEALRQVFDTILEENPPSVARSIIKSIADAITSLINRLLLSTPKSGFNELGISREELLSLKKEIQAAMVASFKEDIKRRDNKISAARTAPSSEPSATGAPTYGKRDAAAKRTDPVADATARLERAARGETAPVVENVAPVVAEKKVEPVVAEKAKKAEPVVTEKKAVAVDAVKPIPSDTFGAEFMSDDLATDGGSAKENIANHRKVAEQFNLSKWFIKPKSSVRKAWNQAVSSIPWFMGGKRRLAGASLEYITKYMGDDAKKFNAIEDMFGGSGSFGMTLAETVLPNAKIVRITEFDPVRQKAINWRIHKDDLRGILDRNKTVIDAVFSDITNGKDGLFGSVSPAEPGIQAAAAKYGKEMSGTMQMELAVFFKSVADRMFAGRTAGGSGQLLPLSQRIAALVEMTIADSDAQFAQANRLKERGVTITVQQGSSYESQAPSKDTFVVADPPYYGTEGYSYDPETLQRTKQKVGPEIYTETERLLSRLKANGNSVLYTDEAWWAKADVDKLAIDGKPIYDRIRSTVDHVDVVPVATRVETLAFINGDNLNGQRKQGRSESRQSTSRLSSSVDERSEGKNGEGRSRSREEGKSGEVKLSPSRHTQPAYDALGDFWLNVAQHKDLFYYPTTDAKTIEKAFEDVVVKKNPSFSIEPVSTTNIEEVGKAPSESGDKVWAIWDGTNLLGKIHERGNEVWISVAGMVSGSGGGASVYSAVGQYARNTGKEFIGDPAGFEGTPGARLGEIRRVEHLISQALRYGSTDHVTLGDDHVANKGWKKGNFRENLDLLLKESYANYEWLFEASPKLAQVKFDVQSEQFTINGRPVSDFHFKALLGHQTRGISGVSGNVGRGTPGVVRGARIGEAIGVSTAKRAIVAKTILEGMDSSAAGRILAGIDTKLDAKGLAAESGIRRVQYSNPRFVSQLATQIDTVPARLATQPATQWKLWLSSNAAKLGIKKDEIEWSGINDYLAMRGKEKVSKADIAAYLSENGTQVNDVVLSDGISGVDEWEIVRNGKEDYSIIDGSGKIIEGGFLARQSAQAFIDQKRNSGSPTKFSQYVVPGGENYRELLITLPENAVTPTASEARRLLLEGKNNRGEATKKEFAELLQIRKVTTRPDERVNFRSSHFDQPNILAHLRFDERPDAEGNKVLFIQELQSDWGQEGKKEGFAKPVGNEALDALRAQKAALVEKYGSVERLSRGSAEDNLEYTRLSERIDLLKFDSFGVPTAPFVQDTKNWVALGLKRAIMYAVQHGMTRVAWANGEQNADHYDLSKQVSRITYEGTYLRAFDHSHNEVIGKTVQEDDLADTIGKDAADKLMAQEGKKIKGSPYVRRELSGLDLKVGGEGMRAFYDQIVPQVANDVLKKLGGGKVETVDILAPYNLGEHYVGGKLEKIQTAPMPNPQQGFTITPAMQAKVSEGVPLFSPSRSALTGQPIRGANFTLPSETKAQESQRLIQDATNRWEIVQAAVLEQGGTIDDDTNVARAIQLYPGRVGASFEDLNHRLVEPLLERMAKTGATMDQIGTYLYALHAPERNAEMAKKNPRFPDGGSGMTNADAAQLVANFRALPNFVEIDAVAKGFQALTKRRLAFMVRAGVMSQDQMDAYQAAYKAYVPLKGFEDMDENGKPTGSGKGFSTGNKIDKRALGRESRAGQIIENIVRDFEAGLILAEKANVGRVVKAFVEANPDAKLWEVDNPPKEQQMSTAGNVFLKTAQYNPEAEIQFLENGKPVRVQIYDKILLRAYNNIGAKELDAVSKTFNVYNSWLRQMYTQKNPAWFVLNLLKDQQSAAMYMTGEKGAGFALKNLTKMPKAMSLAWAMYHNKPMSAANQALVNDFRRSGGMTGFAYVGDIEAKANQLQGALAKYQTWGETKSQGMKALMTKAINNKFFDYIEALNTTFENTTRLATFMTAIESGASSKEAAQLAKNVTVNFNVHGEYGPSINAWYLFANAGIQGTRNIGHALFYSPHKAQVWALASGAVMLGVLAGMMGDDDDDLIDDSTRSRALVIKVGDSKVLIPTAYGWGFFTSMGQLIAQAMKHPDKREKIALKMASSAFDHFGFFGNPVAGDELSLKSAVANTTPTAVRPFVQSATNTSSFGGPLYPESQFNPTQPDSEKAWRKTKGSAYDQFAKWMNSVSGGDAAQEGAVSVSPESLKQMTSTLGGGALRLVTDMLSLPVEAANNGGVKAKNVPVLKSFYQAIDVDDYRRQFGEAAANAEETLRVANNYKKAARKPGADQSVKEAKKDYDKENQHLIAAGRMVTSYRKRIASLRDEEDKLRAEKGPSEVQRLKLAQNTARQIAAVKQFNVSVKKANNNSLMPDRQ